MPAVQETIDQVKEIDVDKYKYGFITEIESEKAPKGLNEDIVRFISEKKGEPDWMLDWRLDAYRRWRTMDEPSWANVTYPKIDFERPLLLLGAKEHDRPEEPRRGRSGIACHLRKARHPAERTGSSGRRRRRAGGRGRGL